jgi:hypothetical protein
MIGRVAGWTGADPDPRQQGRVLQIAQAFRLPHHIDSREITVALLQHLQHGQAYTIGEHRGGIGDVAARVIFRHEFTPYFHTGIVFPDGGFADAASGGFRQPATKPFEPKRSRIDHRCCIGHEFRHEPPSSGTDAKSVAGKSAHQEKPGR